MSFRTAFLIGIMACIGCQRHPRHSHPTFEPVKEVIQGDPAIEVPAPPSPPLVHSIPSRQQEPYYVLVQEMTRVWAGADRDEGIREYLSLVEYFHAREDVTVLACEAGILVARSDDAFTPDIGTPITAGQTAIEVFVCVSALTTLKAPELENWMTCKDVLSQIVERDIVVALLFRGERVVDTHVAFPSGKLRKVVNPANDWTNTPSSF